MAERSKRLYEFGEFRLDVGERILLRGREPVPLTPKVFDTLVLLVENAGHLIEKDKFMRQLWPDTFVEEVTLARNISRLRKALGETRNGQRFIETVSKRGYRFVAGVQESWEESEDLYGYKSSLWEVSRDRANLHPLLPGWDPASSQAFGRWTPDGEYFLLASNRGGKWNIWSLREKGSLFHRARREPVQVTAGPTDFYGVVRSRDGRRIFVVGYQPKYELVRYDARSGQFLPYLPRIPAAELSFSKNAGWVSYAVDPERTLWRSKMDGSQRLQLTSPPTFAVWPRFSPDGKEILFVDARPGAPPKSYLISIDGATSQELLPGSFGQADPDWSPDGKTIAFAAATASPNQPSPEKAIYLVDLATRQVREVPGSEGLQVPRWSPDGRFLAARTADAVNNLYKLMVFDFSTRRWSDLAHFNYPTVHEWSPKAKYLYFQDLLEPEQSIYRIRMGDRKQERVAGFATLLGGGVVRCGFVGLTPDGSPLAVLTRSLADIYALDLDLP